MTSILRFLLVVKGIPFLLALGLSVRFSSGFPLCFPVPSRETKFPHPHLHLHRHKNKRKPILFALRDSDNSSDQETIIFEDALVELESEKLYGLGCMQSDLYNFASQLERGALNLFPDYQRSFVWKPAKASRLIATVLCNRFIPPLVLHEKKKGCFDVVDGKQRLTSLLGFYMNRKQAQFPGDPGVRDKMLKILPDLATLAKLDESYEALNGLTFDDLAVDRQRAFESYSIAYMVIPLNTPKADVFEVYEDINSGGEDLTQQQVRRAVYHGPYIKLIDCLKDTCSDFHAIRNPKAFRSNTYEPCKKDSDGELILRAFAFRQNGEHCVPSAKKFLNRELEGSEDFDTLKDNDKGRVEDMVTARRNEFESVMRVARQVFGASAFRKKDGDISKTMWDAKYCAIAELLTVYKEVDFTKSKDLIFDSVSKSIQGGYFSKDNERTSAKAFVARKEELKRLLQDSIQQVRPSRDRRRTFPPALKWELYNRQVGICALCDQTIDKDRVDEANYVHIDHILPHSSGGRTEISNAQLTHRECNLQKGARTS